MNNREYRPKMVVKMTLSLHWQNKLLSFLHSHFGISESFENPHTIYVHPTAFVEFMFALRAKKLMPSLDQIKAEYLDLKKEPEITVVRPYGNWKKLDKFDE